MDRKWWALTAACTGTFLLLLDVTKVITSLPQIEQQLHADFGATQWVIDAYLLAMAATLLTSGSLADLFGHRRLFILGLVVFSVASFGGGFAVSPGMLIGFRAVQGIGGAMMYATSLSLLAHNFHGKERGTAFGVWGAVTGLATGLGPIVGGALTAGLGWRAVLLVNVPIGVAAIVITLSRVPADHPAHTGRRLDWPGFVTFTLGLLGLIYGITRAAETSWSDGLALGTITTGLAILAVFVVVQARVQQPMFDLRLLRVPTFTGGLITAFAMNGSLLSLFVYYTIYLQDALGYDPLQTGLRLALITGPTLIVSTLAGRAANRIPVRWIIAPGLLLVGIGILLTAGLTEDSSWAHFLAGFLVAGIGSGLVNPPLASTAVGVVPPHSAGMASGVNTTSRMFGQAFAIAVYGSILTATLRVNDGRGGYATALNDVAVIGGILAIVGAICAAIMIRPRDFVPSTPPDRQHVPR